MKQKLSRILGSVGLLGLLMMPMARVAYADNITITTPSILPNGVEGQEYNMVFDAYGGTDPYKWEFFDQQGASITKVDGGSEINSYDFENSAGTYHFLVKVTDGSGNSAQKNITYTILGDNPNLNIPKPPFPNGTLVKDKGVVYLIMGYKKIPFANTTVLKQLGYSTKNIISKDLSKYNMLKTSGLNSGSVAHPWGSFVKSGSTIYYSDPQGLMIVPDMDTFKSNGGDVKYVVQANQADLANITAKFLQKKDIRILTNHADYIPDETAKIAANKPVHDKKAAEKDADSLKKFNDLFAGMKTVQNPNALSATNDLLAAAPTCSTISKDMTGSLYLAGIVATTTSGYQILGPENGLCRYYVIIKGIVYSVDPAGVPAAIADTTTLADLQKEVDKLNTANKDAIGTYTLCRLSNDDLVTKLTKLKNDLATGEFSFNSSVDLKGCDIGQVTVTPVQ